MHIAFVSSRVITSITHAAALLLGLATPAASAWAQEVPLAADPHAIYERQCIRCHTEHGADLARQKLTLVSGVLRVARTGAALDKLLASHHGVRLAATEAKTLTELFTNGIERRGAFQHRCALCHGHANTFARDNLIVKDGTLVTKSGDKNVAAFLKTHHEVTPGEIDTIVTMLKQQIDFKAQ